MADKHLSSSEFRRSYAGLTEPVAVTVLGRVIGTWYPKGTGPTDDEARPKMVVTPGFNTRPFRPAPKK